MQIIITDNDRRNFENRVQMKLNDGYKAVPGTLTVAVTMTNYGSDTYLKTETVERHAIVLEK
jgi:hypothetical protein